MTFNKDEYWKRRAEKKRGQGEKIEPSGTVLTSRVPINLGIKQFKREHPGDVKAARTYKKLVHASFEASIKDAQKAHRPGDGTATSLTE